MRTQTLVQWTTNRTRGDLSCASDVASRDTFSENVRRHHAGRRGRDLDGCIVPGQHLHRHRRLRYAPQLLIRYGVRKSLIRRELVPNACLSLVDFKFVAANGAVISILSSVCLGFPVCRFPCFRRSGRGHVGCRLARGSGGIRPTGSGPDKSEQRG